MRSYAKTNSVCAMADTSKNLTQILAQLRGDLTLKDTERNKLSKNDLKRYDKLTAILEKLKDDETVYMSYFVKARATDVERLRGNVEAR